MKTYYCHIDYEYSDGTMSILRTVEANSLPEAKSIARASWVAADSIDVTEKKD